MRLVAIFLILTSLCHVSVYGEESRNFEDHILPLLREHCANCHRPGKTRGGLDVTTMEKLEKGGSAGPSVVSGLAENSPLFRAMSPLHKRHGGLWEFPGGKCERGEFDAETIARELREELGVSVVTVGPSLGAIADPGSDYLIVFLPVCIEGEPECLEHAEIRWVRVEEVSELDLAPTDRAFVEAWAPRNIL